VTPKGPEKNAGDRRVGGSGTLRKAAEKCLTGFPAISSGGTKAAPDQVIHELQVHQIELEMQNEALRESWIALEESRDRYAELYEFAPVGYLTLTKEAIITEANLTGALILGVDRQNLIHGRFGKFIAPEDTERWNRYFIRALRTTDKQTREMKIRRGDGSVVNARIESILMERGNAERVVLMAVSDISDRVRAEENLALKSQDLDELKTAYQTIARGQLQLQQNQADLTEALAEKEALLSEIHHRVKNNLTAFISLLNLEGSSEDTEGGKALRNDLQNRARSMALIHETLYQTRKFSSVPMEIYLTTLVSQVAGSYANQGDVLTVVDAKDVDLDLSRATTAGLIVNELVTNSFKYAFPPGYDCMAVRGEPCTIRVSFVRDAGDLVLTVADNGCGLPAGMNPLATKSLGLKLVSFLARHQLRAKESVQADKCTAFIFRLNTQEECT